MISDQWAGTNKKHIVERRMGGCGWGGGGLVAFKAPLQDCAPTCRGSCGLSGWNGGAAAHPSRRASVAEAAGPASTHASAMRAANSRSKRGLLTRASLWRAHRMDGPSEHDLSQPPDWITTAPTAPMNQGFLTQGRAVCTTHVSCLPHLPSVPFKARWGPASFSARDGLLPSVVCSVAACLD